MLLCKCFFTLKNLEPVIRVLDNRVELFENVIASLDDGIIVLDKELIVVALNQAAEMISGVVKERTLHRPFPEVMADNSSLVELARRAVQIGATFHARDMNLSNGKGGSIPVTVTVSPLSDSKGEMAGAVVSLKDLSFSNLIEGNLKNQERLAQLEILAAGVAHELRNPLAGIKVLVGLLERRLEDKRELEEFTQRISKEADRIELILNELLELGKGGVIKLDEVNLNRVLDEVLAASQALAEEKGVRLIADLDVSLPMVVGDKVKLFQLFFNLVKNGLEATGRGGMVNTRSRMVTEYRLLRDRTGAGKMVRVEIRDGGPGIAQEELGKIFAPFYTTKVGGVGMGLAVCARIIDEHKGHIQVASLPGQGTKLEVLLPVKDPEVN
ncbi:MAG: ATP-binding protein [Thermodesulfobacteriota bacterium]